MNDLVKGGFFALGSLGLAAGLVYIVVRGMDADDKRLREQAAEVRAYRAVNCDPYIGRNLTLAGRTYTVIGYSFLGSAAVIGPDGAETTLDWALVRNLATMPAVEKR